MQRCRCRLTLNVSKSRGYRKSEGVRPRRCIDFVVVNSVVSITDQGEDLATPLVCVRREVGGEKRSHRKILAPARRARVCEGNGNRGNGLDRFLRLLAYPPTKLLDGRPST